MKCTNCGAEFEGNFCSNCGMQVTPQTCPVCGKPHENGAMFCSSCGYDFTLKTKTKTEKENDVAEGILAKRSMLIYKIVTLIPIIAFMLFSIFLFIFFSAPVALMPVEDLFEVNMPALSYGNVYTLLGEDTPIAGSLITFIIFAVIAILLAVIFIVKFVLNVMASKKNMVADKVVANEKLCGFISVIIYLVFLIVSSVICGQINNYDKEMNVIVVGSAPVLFILLTTAGLIAENLLRKSHLIAEQLRATQV